MVVRSMPVRLALAAALIAIIGGCSDPEAEKAAIAEQKAKVEQKRKDKLVISRIERSARCVAAIHWKSSTIAKAGVGSPDAYVDYYKAALERDLGSMTLPAEPPKPALSKATIPAFLAWGDTYYVEHDWTNGKDLDHDGTVSPYEKVAIGLIYAQGCVQGAAEAGAGPMGKLEPFERYPKIQTLTEMLRLSAH